MTNESREFWVVILSNIGASSSVIVVLGYFIKRMIDRFETALNGTVKTTTENKIKIAEHEIWRLEAAARLIETERRNVEAMAELWRAIDEIRQRCYDNLRVKKEI